MVDEVRRDVVKLGIDFRTIPVDIGDGVEWEFVPDPSPEQWGILMEAMKGFTKFSDESFGGEVFTDAQASLSAAMANMLAKEKQRAEYLEKNYGLGPQQAVAKALMEMWTGFPTEQPDSSGKGSKPTGRTS